MNDIIGFIAFPTYGNRRLRYGAVAYTRVGSVFFALGTFFVLTGIVGIKAGDRLPADTPTCSRRRILIVCAVMSILGTAGGAPLIALSLINLGPCVQFGLHMLMVVANLGQAIAAGINLCKMPKALEVVQIVFPAPGTYPGAQALVCNQEGQPMYFVPTGQKALPQNAIDAGQPLIKQNNVYQNV
ncbi:uncharacterized protein LOC129597329 [Paramacrobiotus metropolitanus]|uniref:uncharacterized protein LOC129597329 n=1 Tax=Paramacrobiotus metropolitanus TaxID=2943436 RepID=UPI0024457D76|nr:uncharacterized protein LOC129597329 [Paramacrobiotus metropolitanus]